MAEIKIRFKGRTHYCDVDIVGILKEYGIEGDISGSEYVAYCPFHTNIHSPSFSVKLEGDNAGCWQCFSSDCGKTGNIITLIAELEGCSNREAIQSLITVEDTLSNPSRIPDIGGIILKLRQVGIESHPSQIIYPVPSSCTHWFVREFFTYPIEQGGRGYSVEQFEKLHTDDVMYCPQGYYKNRIILPIVDIDTPIQIAFIARSVSAKDKPKYLFPKGWLKEYCVGHYPVDNSEPPVVCEGGFDGIHVQGIWERTALPVFGSSPSSTQVAKIAKRYERVDLAFDGDSAGRTGAYKMTQQLLAFGVDVGVYLLPDGTDPPCIGSISELTWVDGLSYIRRWEAEAATKKLSKYWHFGDQRSTT